MTERSTYIPVLEVEELRITKDGRGINIFATTWPAKDFNVWVSGSEGAGYGKRVLPAPSTIAWIKIHYVSGGTGTATDGYIPVFNDIEA